MMASGSACECSRARSGLSITGSHSAASAALVSAAARLTWVAHLLRMLSASASARSRWSCASASLASRSATAAARLAVDSMLAASSVVPSAPALAVTSGCPWSAAPASFMSRELCVNHVVIGIGRPRLGRIGRRAALRRDSARCGQRLVDLLELSGQLLQALQWRIALERLPRVARQRLGPGLLVHRDRVAAPGQEVLDGVCSRVQLVAGVGQLAQPVVLITVLLGIPDHPLDFRLVKVGALTDRDPLLGAGVLVRGGDVQDP